MSDSILAKILAVKQREVAELRPRAMRESWRDQALAMPAAADFLAPLRKPGRMRVIAEIKKASPSAGVIRPDFEPAALARDYASHGADALSVLTDVEFFEGALPYLSAAHKASNLPVLRKDFVIDESQIWEARRAGASAVLLIAECLAPAALQRLTTEIHALGMTALVELHDADNLPAVLASGARLIGVNNRDLRTFQTDLQKTLDLLPHIPREVAVVSESGISTAAQVRRLADAGVAALLIGEAFMRQPSPGAALAKLLDSSA